jgi:hypothetical protein
MIARTSPEAAARITAKTTPQLRRDRLQHRHGGLSDKHYIEGRTQMTLRIASEAAATPTLRLAEPLR